METKIFKGAVFLLFFFLLNFCQAEEKGYYLPGGVEVSSEAEPFITGWAMNRYWNDGLVEKSVYRSERIVYGKKRSFEKVHLMNRQRMDATKGVKAEKNLASRLPVIKFNIYQTIPTEYYDYRYLTTQFYARDNLKLFKMTQSSQEYCGNCFKIYKWGSTPDEILVRQFPYFPDERDSTYTLKNDFYPFEGLPLILRSLNFKEGLKAKIRLLHRQISNRLTPPQVRPAEIEVRQLKKITVPAGEFEAWLIWMNWDGKTYKFAFGADFPHLMLYTKRPDGTADELVFAEKVKYW